MVERKGRPRADTKVISGRISPKTFDAVIKIIAKGAYVDVTDYLRDVIRKDLESRGVTL